MGQISACRDERNIIAERGYEFISLPTYYVRTVHYSSRSRYSTYVMVTEAQIARVRHEAFHQEGGGRRHSFWIDPESGTVTVTQAVLLFALPACQ